MGQIQKVTRDDIVNKIAQEADLTPDLVAQVRVYDAFSFLEVPESEAEKVHALMNKNMWKGYRVRMEPARGRDGSAPSGPRPPRPASSRPPVRKNTGGAPWKGPQKK
mgnify:FL=1